MKSLTNNYHFSGHVISLIIALCCLSLTYTRAQTVYYHVANTGLYSFLDEMAAGQLIEVNAAVKPYSRMFIARRLDELSRQRERLNPRQQKELDFYLKDFNKELKPDKQFDRRFDVFYFRDDNFQS